GRGCGSCSPASAAARPQQRPAPRQLRSRWFRRSSERWGTLPRSGLLRHAFAEDALRTKDQEGNENEEREAVLVRHGNVGGPERLDDAECETSDDRSLYIPEAADD